MTSFLSSTESRRPTVRVRVPAVFPQDAPSVLNGTNERILIGIVHGRVRNSTKPDSKLGENFRSPLALRFYVSEAIAIVPRSVHSRVDSLSPRGQARRPSEHGRAPLSMGASGRT